MTDIFLCVPELTRFCSFPLGVQSGRIKNSQMTSSSVWNRYHAPFLGRLKRVRTGRYMGGWAARHNNHNQWIQVDLGRLFKVTMISTQGRKIVKQWVTRYTVSYSLDAVHYVSYKQRDRLKVYTRLCVKYFFFFFNLASIVLLTRLPELVWDLYFILGLLFGLNLATLGRRQESEVGFKNKGLWSPCVLYFVRTRSFKNDVMLWRAEKKQFAPR